MNKFNSIYVPRTSISSKNWQPAHTKICTTAEHCCRAVRQSKENCKHCLKAQIRDFSDMKQKPMTNSHAYAQDPNLLAFNSYCNLPMHLKLTQFMQLEKQLERQGPHFMLLAQLFKS